MAAALLLDRIAGAPRRGHSVATFGRGGVEISERLLYADARLSAMLHAGLLVGGAAGLDPAARPAGASRDVF